MMGTAYWFIGLLKNDKLYYVADVDLDEGTVLWCDSRPSALKFRTEAAVSNYVEKALSGRTDVHLIHSDLEE